jgi:hypothetical protein
MYNITASGTQVLDSVLLRVSVTETDDLGRTSVLFTVQRCEDIGTPETEPETLERFLDQVSIGLSRALSVRWDGSTAP